jgi:hypothetical protein
LVTPTTGAVTAGLGSSQASAGDAALLRHRGERLDDPPVGLNRLPVEL